MKLLTFEKLFKILAIILMMVLIAGIGGFAYNNIKAAGNKKATIKLINEMAVAERDAKASAYKQGYDDAIIDIVHIKNKYQGINIVELMRQRKTKQEEVNKKYEKGAK